MRALHWVRIRQEERQLSYWLSIVAYEQHDRSLGNHIYLLYLIIFFSVWLFVMLTFFASGGSMLLRLLSPSDPVRGANFLELLLLAIWSIVAFWISMRRSPVVFSEQDEVLICQMPVNRRHVTLRWMLMPWLKSAVPFWLIAIAIGFSVAETTMTGVIGGNRILEYAEYGLRAWMVIVPIHLAIFSLQWAVGIVRLQKDHERDWLFWLVIPGTIIFYSLVLFFTYNANLLALPYLVNIVKTLIYPLRAGFMSDSISISLISGAIFALAALGILIWSSGTFNLSRAAQETREVDKIETALRYGFRSYAKQLQDQRRLGVKHAPSKIPTVAGASVFIWKDVLQTQRSFCLSSLFIWFRLFVLMLSFAFLPDLGIRALVIGYWVILLGQVSVVRIRSDLLRWPIIRQLPISHKKFLLFDLAPAYLLSVLISIVGLVISSGIFKKPLNNLIILLPGIAASVAGLAAFDIIRRARSNLLIAESVPEVGAGGIILGLGTAAVPLLISNFVPGIVGLILSTLLSLGLGVLACNLAVHFFHKIDTS